VLGTGRDGGVDPVASDRSFHFWPLAASAHRSTHYFSAFPAFGRKFAALQKLCSAFCDPEQKWRLYAPAAAAAVAAAAVAAAAAATAAAAMLHSLADRKLARVHGAAAARIANVAVQHFGARVASPRPFFAGTVLGFLDWPDPA
jgi:hypothetical protein